MTGLNLLSFLVLLSVFASAAQRPPANYSDLDSAFGSMRDRAYYGFIILLQMLSSQTVAPPGGITFLIPNDRELAIARIPPAHVQDFILSHSIPDPLYFNNMLHFPTGTLIPTGVPNLMLDITNGGPYDFYVNNAKIVAPNVCQSARIKCHGIDAVIHYNDTIAQQPLPANTRSPITALPVLQPVANFVGNLSPTSSPLHRNIPSPLGLDNESSLQPILNVLSHTSSIGAGAAISCDASLLITLIGLGFI